MQKSYTVDALVDFFSDKYTYVELNHVLEEGIPTFSTLAKYSKTICGSLALGDMATHHLFTFSDHSGTHADSPNHYIKGGKSVDQLLPGQMIGRGVHIEAANLPDNGLMTKERILKWEEENSQIRQGDIILFDYGYHKRWFTRPQGDSFVKGLWPGLSDEGAKYLLEKKVAVVGSDAISVDACNATDYPAHNILLGNGILLLECLANLSVLPALSFVICLPLRMSGASGSPVRVIAMIEK